ncbi:MAG TPA: zf-HC2 domain-containing protein [Gemmatimonadaceae bacterium]|jgi:hypothetical protein
MQHLEEGTIHAWLDGALDAEESARVEQHVTECAMCANAVAEARGLVAGASRILAALDDVPSGVIPGGGGGTFGSGSAATRRPRSLWTVTHMTPARAAAAAIVIMAAGTALVMHNKPGSPPVAGIYPIKAGQPARNQPVPATPTPAVVPTVADSIGFARPEPSERQRAKVLVLPAPAPAPAPLPSPGRKAAGEEMQSAAVSRVSSSMDSVAVAPAAPARDLVRTDSARRLAAQANASVTATAAPAVAGGELKRAGAPVTARMAVRLLAPQPQYAGCYSVAARGDSLAPLPKLLSLDTLRFDQVMAERRPSVAGSQPPATTFAVSSVADHAARRIDSASWQPVPGGVRISFGRTPVELKVAADSMLSAGGVAGRGVGMTLQRVDCPWNR